MVKVVQCMQGTRVCALESTSYTDLGRIDGQCASGELRYEGSSSSPDYIIISCQ